MDEVGRAREKKGWMKVNRTTGTFVRNVHNDWQQMFLESLCTFCTNVPVIVPVIFWQ
jgi:hypothetical protein